VYDSAPTNGDGTKVRQIAFVLEPDFVHLGSSSIYNISKDGITGTLQFCVKLEVYLPDNTTKVNWREITYSQTTTLQEGINRRLKSTKLSDDVTNTNFHES